MVSSAPRTSRRRWARSSTALALAAALLAGGTIALGTAGPATAEPPTDAGRPVAASAGGDRNPNADDDAYKDVPCELLPPDNSNNGSPKEQDQTDGCAPAPQPVAVVQAATIADPVDLLPCGESITTDGRGQKPDVEVTRLTDADKTSDDQCDPFPYDLKAVDGGMRFLKPNGYPYSQFFLEVDWRSDKADLEPSLVDFELIEGGYLLEIPRCPDTLRDPETGDVTGLTPDMDLTPAGLAAMGVVDQDGMPGAEGAVDNGLIQYVCTIDRTIKYVPEDTGEGHFRMFERMYLLGDIFIRRP